VFHSGQVEVSLTAARTVRGGAEIWVVAFMEKVPLGPWVGVGIAGVREEVVVQGVGEGIVGGLE